MLNMSGVALPNQTLPVKWYNGHEYRVEYLTFDGTEIIAIEAGAFDTPAFNYLLELNIMNPLHIIEYTVGMFEGLLHLVQLLIEEGADHRSNPSLNLLQPLSNSLRWFIYEGDIGHSPVLNDLFGGNALVALTNIGVLCSGKSELRVVAAANFTGLPSIRVISLSNCGIETIEPDAFHQVSHTLITLVLLENNLLQPSVHMFRVFLDKWTENAVNFKYLRICKIIEELCECTMAHYRVRNASMISFHYKLPDHDFDACRNDIHVMSDEAMQQQQIIHPQRWHLNHSMVWKYVFPKFHVHFNAVNATLDVIQFDQDDHYRLLIRKIDHKTLVDQQKCPSTMWIASNVKCVRGTRLVENVIIPKFDDSNDGLSLIAACIIHISYRKQSLPLHCRTIAMPKQNYDFFPLQIILIYICLLIFNVVITICCTIFMKRMMAQYETAPTLQPDTLVYSNAIIDSFKYFDWLILISASKDIVTANITIQRDQIPMRICMQ